jgi:hypothetical protein
MIWALTGIDTQCQSLIDANAQSLELIRTIQINYTVTMAPDNGKKQVDEVWWNREPGRERIRRVTDLFQPRADGRQLGISDVVLDGDSYKWLQNWDPEKPQKITPSRQGTVRASVGPRTNVNPASVSPAQQLLFEVFFAPRRTLRELAAVSPNLACKGKVVVDGRELWRLSLESPEENTPRTVKRFFDVYLDPLAGHMIRRMVMDAPNILLPDGKAMKETWAYEVVEFKDLGDGVFVPIRIRTGTPKQWLAELAVKSLKVNEPIPRETFEMQWPQFAAVHYYPLVDGKVKFEIWGDGKPIKEFIGPADLNAFETELRNDSKFAGAIGPGHGAIPPPPASTLTRLSLVLAVLLALMVALVIRRRIREQSA